MAMHLAEDRSVAGLGFSIDDFNVPRHYLSLVTGAENHSALFGDQSSTRYAHNDRIPTITFVDVCLKYFRTTGSEIWAGSQSLPFGAFGLLVAAAAQATDFADALCRAADAISILGPDVRAQARRSRGALRFSLQSTRQAPNVEVGLEFMAIAVHCAFRWLTESRLRPLHVRAAGETAAHEMSMMTILSCPVLRRGSGVTISYEAMAGDLKVGAQKYESWATQELPEFLALLREAAMEINQDISVERPVISRVRDLVKQGVIGEERVASRLGMSSASLRRRLAEAGTTFRQVLDLTRRDIVAQLLRTESPLLSVAAAAYFSDVRSLRRACLRWFGETPGRYRGAREETRQASAEQGFSTIEEPPSDRRAA